MRQIGSQRTVDESGHDHGVCPAGVPLQGECAHIPGCTALALVVTVVIGAASFCCLGYALTSFIRNEDAALPTAQALVQAA